MKTRVVLLSFASALFAMTAVGQSIESDDMYFNSKDRAKLRSQQKSEVVMASAKTTKPSSRVEEDINPTDSYSARNINPEFTARSNAQTAAADNQDYFVSNYQYQTASDLNTWNNNFNNAYNSPWYTSNYYGSSMNYWNSTYGNPYTSWGNPWCSPYNQSGWSNSFGYYGGNSWNYGWGMNYGYGNPYMNSYWGPTYGYGYNNFYNGYYGYGSNVVVVNNNYYEGTGRTVTYGKRGSAGRTTVANNRPGNTTAGSRDRTTSVGSSSGTISSGGRIATTPPTTRTISTGRTRQDEYYNRSWRSSSTSGNAFPGTTTSPSRNTSSNDNWNWNNSSNTTRSRSSSFDSGSSSGSSSSFSTPSRSSSGDSGRSSGSSSGSSSSSGTRGRTRGN